MRFLPPHCRLLVGVLLLSACGDPAPPVERLQPIITDIRASSPMIEGTLMQVSVANIGLLGSSPDLIIDQTYSLPAIEVEGGQATFRVSTSLVSALGDGLHNVQVTISSPDASSNPYPFLLEFASSLPVSLDDGLSLRGYRNDAAILRGGGFLEEGEGQVSAHFVGMFTPETGTESPVDVFLPVVQAEVGDRTRGTVLLTTELGGLHPGHFVGTLTLRSEPANLPTSESMTRDADVVFQPPVFLAFSPPAASLESIVSVRGGGFLGGTGGDEVTLVRVEGTFTPNGGRPEAFNQELVLRWRSGEELQWTIEAEERRGELVSTVFGASSGVLEALFTPIAVKGREESPGTTVAARFTLNPPRQVVWVRFLPGFYASLPSFGVASAAGTIEALVKERIEGIYDDWQVEVRLEEPEDVAPTGVTVIEVGGPDPNGIGLFGYDNSPGKDVGNLRLFDRIGGANADTQADGYPGYGGVFIDGFLFFSATDAPTMGSGPQPDPLFDEIFAGVRANPATLAEVRGAGDRAAEVARAVAAMASMIGETTAHELGHSLGMADPLGPMTVFHNRTDRPGCLMDSGSARPFGERTAQEGFSRTHVCGDNASYLDSILGE